jgi:hypothetical protein
MAKKYAKDGIFGSPEDFDIDLDGEYCGIIGGEMCDRDTVGPAWDWRPDMKNAEPAMGVKCLGELDCMEFHTAREGTRGK